MTNNLFRSNYTNAFGAEPGADVKKAGPAAALASAAVGFAVDLVTKELENEAKQYEAQFTAEELADNFWDKVDASGGIEPRYYGLEITRSLVRGEKTRPAFLFTCGFGYSTSAGLWVARPLILQTKEAKAKVISGKLWHQLLVFPWLLRKPGSEIKSKIEVEMNGFLRDTDQQMKTIPMGILSYEFGPYNMSKSPCLMAVNGLLPKKILGPFNSAPVPVDNDGKPRPGVGGGLFSIKALVTESDVSNVKERIEKAAKFVASKKEDLQKKVNPNKSDNKQ